MNWEWDEIYTFSIHKAVSIAYCDCGGLRTEVQLCPYFLWTPHAEHLFS